MESIVDGTWGSGSPPAEWVAFTLMRGMKWSSAEFHDTPAYEVRFCYDFLCVIAEYEREQADRAERQRQQNGGGG